MRAKRIVLKDYDRAAQSYDYLRFFSAGGRHADQIEKNLLSRIVTGKSALEIGTATGRFAVLLLGLGYEYTGIDLSLRMLQVTSRRTSFNSESRDLLRMDAEAMCFRPRFDNAICIRTFHFLPDPSLALRNIRDALTSGGRCLVTFETDNPIRKLALWLNLGRSQQRYYKRKEVEDLFRAAGFRVMESGSVLRLPVTLYRRTPKRLIWILRVLEQVWPWPTHEYVLGEMSQFPVDSG
jgi:SAM-dependent methyltransferase